MEAKLDAALVEAHGRPGRELVQGLPDCYENPHGTHICNIVWLHLITKAWACMSSAATGTGLRRNIKHWEAGSFEDNASDWGYMPGNAFNPSVDYTALLSRSPDPARALRTLREAHAWFSKTGAQAVPPELAADCAPAYDMQPEVPWPEGGKKDKHPGQS